MVQCFETICIARWLNVTLLFNVLAHRYYIVSMFIYDFNSEVIDMLEINITVNAVDNSNNQLNVNKDGWVFTSNGWPFLICTKCYQAHAYQTEVNATCKTCGAKRSQLMGLIVNIQEDSKTSGTWRRCNDDISLTRNCVVTINKI